MRKIRLLYRLAAIDDHGTADDEASRIRKQPHDRSRKSGNEHPGRQLEFATFPARETGKVSLCQNQLGG